MDEFRLISNLIAMTPMSVKPLPDVSFDTNILVYALSAGQQAASAGDAHRALAAETNRKAAIALELIGAPSVISTQVLSEFTNVARRKLPTVFSLEDIDQINALMEATHCVMPINPEVVRMGLNIAKAYQFRTHDCNSVAVAYLANCKILYTEDMSDGQLIFDTLVIRNPFAGI